MPRKKIGTKQWGCSVPLAAYKELREMLVKLNCLYDGGYHREQTKHPTPWPHRHLYRLVMASKKPPHNESGFCVFGSWLSSTT